MLYQLYETHRAITEPFADFAKATSRLLTNPSWSFSQTPAAQRAAATYDLLYRLGKNYEKPEFGIDKIEIDGVEVGIDQQTETELPFCRLLRFKRLTDKAPTLEVMTGQPVVLIVAPLSGHYATLLRETVRTMLQGHKVYITDWKNARMVPLSEGHFHLDDYVNYVQDFIRLLQKKHGSIHVMSVCQPTVPVLAAVSLMASRGEDIPSSLVMMGGPVDARKRPTSVNDLASQHSFEWFENNLIYRVPYGYPGADRFVYPGFLQYTGFVAMNPQRHASSYYDYFRNLIQGDNDATEHHRQFYDEYNAVLDMDAPFYLETIETVFQEFKLVKGTWDVCSPEGKIERVRPQDIKGIGLITVEGELDNISGLGQTRAAQTLCSSLADTDRAHLEVKGAGHYGIFSGSRWRKNVYPVLQEFLLRFEPAQTGQGKTQQSRKKTAAGKAAAAAPAAPAKKASASAKKTAGRTAGRKGSARAEAAKTPAGAAKKTASPAAAEKTAKTSTKSAGKTAGSSSATAKVPGRTSRKTARKTTSAAASAQKAAATPAKTTVRPEKPASGNRKTAPSDAKTAGAAPQAAIASVGSANAIPSPASGPGSSLPAHGTQASLPLSGQPASKNTAATASADSAAGASPAAGDRKEAPETAQKAGQPQSAARDGNSTGPQSAAAQSAAAKNTDTAHKGSDNPVSAEKKNGD